MNDAFEELLPPVGASVTTSSTLIPMLPSTSSRAATSSVERRSSTTLDGETMQDSNTGAVAVSPLPLSVVISMFYHG